MNNPICDSCGEEMEFSKRLSNGRSKAMFQYRRIRYYCPICDVYHTQYMDGSIDEDNVSSAVDQAKKEWYRLN